MKTRQKMLTVIGLVAMLSIGFFWGKSVQADPIQPGSQNDPLVSKSYVDKQVNDQLAQMTAKVQQLQDKAQALQEKLDQLEAQTATK